MSLLLYLTLFSFHFCCFLMPILICSDSASSSCNICMVANRLSRSSFMVKMSSACLVNCSIKALFSLCNRSALFALDFKCSHSFCRVSSDLASIPPVWLLSLPKRNKKVYKDIFISCLNFPAQMAIKCAILINLMLICHQCNLLDKTFLTHWLCLRLTSILCIYTQCNISM